MIPTNTLLDMHKNPHAQVLSRRDMYIPTSNVRYMNIRIWPLQAYVSYVSVTSGAVQPVYTVYAQELEIICMQANARTHWHPFETVSTSPRYSDLFLTITSH